MKILYVSDVHEEYEKLKKVEEFRKDTNPDLVMLSGDFLDIGVNSEYFDVLRSNIAYYLQRNFKEDDFPYPEQYLRALPHIAEYMKDDKEGTRNTRWLAQEYLEVLDKIEEAFKKKYKDLTKIVESEFLMLPGNYDIDLDKINKKRNFHKKVRNIKGFKIAGYGSANDPWLGTAIVPLGIPHELTIPFFEQTDGQGKLVKSEAKKFFEQKKPDIAFTYMPPRGLRDLMMSPLQIKELVKKNIIIPPEIILQERGVASDQKDYYYFLKNEILFNHHGEMLKRHIQKGSPGLREYLEQGFTKLLCCGHVHECVGVEKLNTEKGQVVVFNGGSLIDGYFSEIFLNDENKKLESITLYQLKEEEIIINTRGLSKKIFIAKTADEYTFG